MYKRYSDFDKLRMDMVQTNRDAAALAGRSSIWGAGDGFAGTPGSRSGGESGAAEPPSVVPLLPKKRWRSLSADVVQERMAGLQLFLTEVTQQRNYPANAKMLAKFLMVTS